MSPILPSTINGLKKRVNHLLTYFGTININILYLSKSIDSLTFLVENLW